MKVQDRLIKYAKVASASDPFAADSATPSHPRDYKYDCRGKSDRQ